MSILIAPDKFKTTLSSCEAAEAIAAGIRAVCPRVEVVPRVVSDGGEGFIEAVEQAEPLRHHPVAVPGPTGKPHEGFLGVAKETGRIYIESSQATGFHLIPERERNPFRTSSEGLSVLIREAAALHPKEIYIGLGSSATCDAGLPVAKAFGYRFYGEDDKILNGSAAELVSVRRIAPPKEGRPGREKDISRHRPAETSLKSTCHRGWGLLRRDAPGGGEDPGT